MSSADGSYLPQKPSRIVAALPNPYKRLAQPERLLRGFVAGYLIHSYKPFLFRQRLFVGLLNPWLGASLAGLVAREPSQEEAARLNRKVLSSALDPINLFYRPLRARGQGQAAFAQITRFIYDAHSLGHYLFGCGAPPERVGRFRAFFNDLKRRDNYDTVFRRHFGYGLDQLYKDWREWVIAKGIGEHEPPPSAIRRALLDHVIPLVADRRAVPEDRVRAIRDMGQAGYTLGADTLIDLLRDRNGEVRASAIWALEMISGTAGGENIAHWEAWWDGLPHEAEPADLDDEKSKADERLFRKEP